MRIRIISTGGTIDKVYFAASSEFEVGSPQAGVLLAEANVGSSAMMCCRCSARTASISTTPTAN
jgi:L-asparaginase